MLERIALTFAAACLTSAAPGCERAGDGTKSLEQPVPKVTVTLLDAGREPRVPLRMRAKVGFRGTFQVVMSLDYELGGQRLPGSTVRETYDSEVVELTREGAFHVHQAIRGFSVELHPGARPRTRAEGKTPVGHTADAWIDARGAHVRPSIVHEPEDASDEDRTPRAEMMTIAPEEAIGVGARWHERVEVGGGFADVDEELLAHDGDHVRLRRTFHAERTIAKHPASFDGTVDSDYSEVSPEYTSHTNATFSTQTPRGPMKGIETFDVVRVP